MSSGKKIMVSAAIAGILAGGMMLSQAASAKEKEMGKCYGANKCKGKSACMGAPAGTQPSGKKGNTCGGPNGCTGHKNECKGQGYLETSKKECEKLIKKNKATKFEANPKTGEMSSDGTSDSDNMPAESGNTDADSADQT